MVTCVLATLFISKRLAPIYESTASVDVDRQAPSEVIGQDSTRSAALNDADQFLATQVNLIQSDAVLRPVAEKYNLFEQENQFSGLTTEEVQWRRQAPVALKHLKRHPPPHTYLLLDQLPLTRSAACRRRR